MLFLSRRVQPWFVFAVLLTLASCGQRDHSAVRPGDLVYSGVGGPGAIPGGYIVSVFCNEIDDRRRPGLPILCAEIAFVEPQTLEDAWIVDSRFFSDALDVDWVSDVEFTWILSDDSEHVVSLVLDGRDRTFEVGGRTLPFEPGWRFVIVLDEFFTPTLYDYDGDRRLIPLPPEAERHLRQRWD